MAMLLAIGSLGWLPFLAAGGTLAIVAGILAAIWRADLEDLATRLEQPGLVDGADEAKPRLPFLAPLAEAASRLSDRIGEQKARLSERRAIDEAIVEHLPDPVLVLDGGHRLSRANAAARSAFGADVAAVLRHPELRAAMARALASRSAEAVEISLPVPVERTVRVTVLAPERTAPGGTVLVLSDRTHERAVERMRADFVANASHELRTPLASLSGFIETLRGAAADDPPAQRRFLGIMAREAARMQRLIEDLLSLSRIELVEHQPPSGKVELADLLSGLVPGFAPRLAERRMEIALAVSAGLPQVMADQDQLAQVLHNLLDNAVKYGREGGRIEVRAEAGERGVVIAVADDGPGIPRQHLPRLTERFYRVDKGRSRAVGGTGLGLAIVKHIVNRHRGRLTIESTEGEGATFRVWLPAAEEPVDMSA